MKKSGRRRRHQELLRAIESHIEKKKGKLTAEQERKLEAALTRKSEPGFSEFFDLVLGVYRRRVEELRDELGIQDRHDAMIVALLEMHALHMWLVSRDVLDLEEDLRVEIQEAIPRTGRERVCESTRRGGV